jgi:hypothetical protein
VVTVGGTRPRDVEQAAGLAARGAALAALVVGPRGSGYLSTRSGGVLQPADNDVDSASTEDDEVSGDPLKRGRP